MLALCFISGLSITTVHGQTAKSALIKPDPAQVALDLQRVADWQIHHIRDSYSGRNKPHHLRDWMNGALYVGMLKWAKISGDPRYQTWLKSIAERGEWQLHSRPYNADDHIIGQLYLDLYRSYNDAAMVLPTQKSLEYLMANPSKQPIHLGKNQHFERWTWCDALFMSPPVWAKMTAITGDNRYLNWMISEFKATTDHLFDEKEGLYYRDNNYIDKRIHGEKVFWARGNGWVFAGLTLIMDELNENSPEYDYFKTLYLKMANQLKKIQTEEGHWAMSLLNGKQYPTPETSGTSFFVYGLSWGMNNGLLAKNEYTSTVYKAWHALASYITDEGMLGYVQPIGAAPGSAWPDKTEVYGSGAFLAAGSELYKLISSSLPVSIPLSKNLDSAIKYSDAMIELEYLETDGKGYER